MSVLISSVLICLVQGLTLNMGGVAMAARSNTLRLHTLGACAISRASRTARERKLGVKVEPGNGEYTNNPVNHIVLVPIFDGDDSNPLGDPRDYIEKERLPGGSAD
jgi:hypothetical protein